MTNFADRLLGRIEQLEAPIVMGLDPKEDYLPKELYDPRQTDSEAIADAITAFNFGLIEAVHDLIPAIKPQFAFYERLGLPGLSALRETIRYAKAHDLIVLGDAKRGDIASSASAYADALFDIFECDAVTLNAYLGSDSIAPYQAWLSEGKGIYLLVRTSNPSAGDLQDLILEDGRTIYQAMADLIHQWGQDYIGERGFSAIGAVVGATWPTEAKELRGRMPKTPFLIPGYGAQGGSAASAVAGFHRGVGGLINASRSIMGAYQKTGDDFRRAARLEVLSMRQAISWALKEQSYDL
ncbi:MAG TPA: orotidine-5'-phosphate decarboxylase [Tissierellia bacterium]|nr:orotidine-5'-phosphate decarboxylase [Tissierellia bacterium]